MSIQGKTLDDARQRAPSPRNRREAARQLLGVCILFIPLLCGCPPPDREHGSTARGPARETGDIVSTIQSNAGKVDRALWSNNVSVTARFKDDNGKRHVHNLEGSLLFRWPRDLRIDLRPGLGEKIMGIGSNQDEYWAWIEPEVGAMRWGRHQNSGKPCAEKIPVRPDQLATVLGFGGLPEASEGLLGPGRKYGRGQDILSYWHLGPDGRSLKVDREYFIDRSPPFLVRVVVFYDDHGRRVMSALLDDYRAAWNDGPLVAHRINVNWPADDGNFTMTAHKIEGRAEVNPRAFARPTQAELPAGVRRIIQVDAHCDQSALSASPSRAP